MVKIKATLFVYCASIFDDTERAAAIWLIDETNKKVGGVEVGSIGPADENDENSDRMFTITGDVATVRKWIASFYDVTDKGVDDILDVGTWYYEEV